MTVSSDHIVVYMMNGRGNILHSFEIKKIIVNGYCGIYAGMGGRFARCGISYFYI